MTYILLGFFLLLILVSYYCSKTQKFREGLFILVLISYVQGVLLAHIFYPDYDPLLFTVSVIVAIFYYIYFPKIVPIINLGWQMKKSSKTQAYSNEDVYSQCLHIWNIPRDKCLIRVFFGDNSFDAHRAGFSPKSNILIGENLLDALNDNEILFVLSHEIGHKFKRIRNIVYTVVFCFLYPIFCQIVAILLVTFKIANIYSFFISGMLLFLIGLILYNYIQWIDEYSADIKAVQTTNDRESAILALQKISKDINEKNHGIILNLIISDHPFTGYRISKIQGLS